jgi:hypothetical protein
MAFDPPWPTEPVDPTGPGPYPPRPEVFNYRRENNNPNPATICNYCKNLIGHVFAPGTEPPVPSHTHCFCFYVETTEDPTDPVFPGGPVPAGTTDEPEDTTTTWSWGDWIADLIGG